MSDAQRTPEAQARHDVMIHCRVLSTHAIERIDQLNEWLNTPGAFDDTERERLRTAIAVMRTGVGVLSRLGKTCCRKRSEHDYEGR